MKERLFRFKGFSVIHAMSALPIGVDGVLIGAWARVPETGTEVEKTILDAGTGCGVIAMMIASRYANCHVEGIDIHLPSVEEAGVNFRLSPWSSRLKALAVSFDECVVSNLGFYDALVSNPPFYDSGLSEFSNSRLEARHMGSLSPAALVEKSSECLRDGGLLSFITVSDQYEELCKKGENAGLKLVRACFVRNNPESKEKRVMMEFVKIPNDTLKPFYYEGKASFEITHLTMFDSSGCPTEEYRKLCGDFYLAF